MGFLIFAFRKLALRQSINQKSYQQMCLSTQQQRIQDQISIMKQTQSTMKEAWSTISGSMSSSVSDIFGNKVDTSRKAFDKATQDYADIKKSGSQSEIDAAKSKVDAANAQYIDAYDSFNFANTKIAARTQTLNSVFAAQEDIELASLNRKDQKYDLELKSLDSSLKLLNAEYDGVEKAESDAAKNSAPKFGLS